MPFGRMWWSRSRHQIWIWISSRADLLPLLPLLPVLLPPLPPSPKLPPDVEVGDPKYLLFCIADMWRVLFRNWKRNSSLLKFAPRNRTQNVDLTPGIALIYLYKWKYRLDWCFVWNLTWLDSGPWTRDGINPPLWHLWWSKNPLCLNRMSKRLLNHMHRPVVGLLFDAWIGYPTASTWQTNQTQNKCWGVPILKARYTLQCKDQATN